jgi:5,5'-dehydrodivanillate O-demethylase
VAGGNQDKVADRSEERLRLSDKGIILYRQLLKQECDKVQRGQDPMNVFRDPAKNAFLTLRLENAKLNGGSFRAGPRRTRTGLC